ncbi:MAG: substrate-binding domain-containing protein, partial [Fusobacteriaceae bacterium]
IPHTFVAYKPICLKENITIFKSDNIDCGYNVARFLHLKGCKNLLTITSKNHKLTDYNDRTLGFHKYLKEQELLKYERHIYECDMSFEDGKNLILNHFEFFKKFDGIYCQQDKVALGILSLIEKFKINIPQDLKLIGHDNLELINYFDPILTSIKEKFNEITLNSLKYLIDIIETNEIKEIKSTFESVIIEKETT